MADVFKRSHTIEPSRGRGRRNRKHTRRDHFLWGGLLLFGCVMSQSQWLAATAVNPHRRDSHKAHSSLGNLKLSKYVTAVRHFLFGIMPRTQVNSRVRQNKAAQRRTLRVRRTLSTKT